MAINMDQVKSFAVTYLDKKEDEIDAAILKALQQAPVSSSIQFDMGAEQWEALKLLWPRYMATGWIDAKYNERTSRVSIIHKLDLGTLKRVAPAPKAGETTETQDRAIKLTITN